nr:hypothetical protein [Micromonospora sp. DSM 115978]
MQPCAVCGSVTINSAGYCAHCGTFRGVPGHPPQADPLPGYGQPQQGYGQQPAYPPGPDYPPSGGAEYPPSGGAGYPSSGGPGYPSSGGPGYPSSGGPGYPSSGGAGYPSSGGPGYPSSGGAGYPGGGGPGFPAGAGSGYPPAAGGAPGYPAGAGYPAGGTGYPTGYPVSPGQPNRRRPLLMPLIALGSTLAVLVVAIVVVVLVRGGGDPDPTLIADPTSGPTSTTPSPTGEPVIEGVDSCVVGDWRVTSHTEEVQDEDLGKLRFTGGEGSLLNLGADGTGRTDYGSGTEFESTWEGKPIVLEIRGSYTYTFRTDDGQVKVSDLDSDAEARVLVDDEQLGQWIDFKPSGDTASYTCTSRSLTQKSLLYTTTFERVS